MIFFEEMLADPLHYPGDHLNNHRHAEYIRKKEGTGGV